MILETQNFQNNCKKILNAVDSSSGNVGTYLELTAENNVLYLNVTNGEYYVSVLNEIKSDETFHAVVDASLFLKLVSKVTTSTLNISIEDNALVLKANGTYKLPLIQNESGVVVQLPKIEIFNVTSEFMIQNEILQNILKYNEKELAKGAMTRDVQKMFYLDEQGCITFTTGACVNNFTLDTPIKILLGRSVVKLFKLFKSEQISFKLGYDELPSGKLAPKVTFSGDGVILTSKLSTDESLINSFPVAAIRKRANDNYAYNVVIDKDVLLDAIERLSLFIHKGEIGAVDLVFSMDSVRVVDKHGNDEVINFVTPIANLEEEYTAKLHSEDLTLTLQTCEEQFITFRFGNNTAITIERSNIKNVIPERRI